MDKARRLAKLIAEMDSNDLLYLKFGGDGDNGETLIEILSALIENKTIDIVFQGERSEWAYGV